VESEDIKAQELCLKRKSLLKFQKLRRGTIRIRIVDRDFGNLDLNRNNLICLNSQIILLTVDPFIR
jgi:hypothetical protein